MKLFDDLHRKFLIIPLILVGCLLAFTFCTIFGVTYTTTMVNINNTVDDAIESITTTNPENTVINNNLIFISIYNDKIQSYHADSYSDEYINKIVERVTNTTQTDFNIDGRIFKVRRKSFSKDGIQVFRVYAVYDYSTQYHTIKTLGFTLLFVYIFCLFIITLLSYLLALNATKPVKDAFEKEKKLIANASHELKTPLTVALTNLELVQSEPNSTVEENKKWLDSATTQMKRMNAMILQMLELSKVESEEHKIQHSPLDFSSLCEGILLSFEAACFEKHITLNTQIEQNLIVLGNSIETEKLVSTLLDNAIKYTNKSGEINVSLKRTSKHLHLVINNTGEGIPPEKISHVFDRFYKVDESHQESGNSFGLGLSIAKSIAESMNGDITCKSEVGKFTEFEVIIPTKN